MPPRAQPATEITTLTVTPTGGFHLARETARRERAATRVDVRQPERLIAAFEEGLGAGLLVLARMDPALPVDPSFSVLSRLVDRYFGQLCKTSEATTALELEGLPAPREALDEIVATRQPMAGGEYLTCAVLEGAWRALDAEVITAVRAQQGTLQDWLQSVHPRFHSVGRVCFHLAEYDRDPGHPFAFLATYSRTHTRGDGVKHAPLAQALREFEQDRAALGRLLRPVHEASKCSTLVQELTDSRAIFHPLAWTAAQAHRFLQQVPALEAAGVLVRIPDWWHERRRPQVIATLGSNPPSGLGLDALLDFRAEVALGGEKLTDAEVRDLLDGTSGLRLVKGRFVEVDVEALESVLDRFEDLRRLAASGALTFSAAARLLAGAGGLEAGVDGEEIERTWARVSAGPWLEALLRQLSNPMQAEAISPGPAFEGTLRPYQRDGLAWLLLLTRLGLGACLADDMGLGKTVQIIALLLLLERQGVPGPHLLVAPASLLGNWRDELVRFAPSLRVRIAHRSEATPAELAAIGDELGEVPLVITTYATLGRLPWIAGTRFGLVVLDEAQAIKNPRTRQSRVVKAVQSQARIALTGTPIENRLTDLWSLYDFLCPGLLGTQRAFQRWTGELQSKSPRDFGPLRRLVAPYLLRRLKTDPAVAPDLPDKTIVRSFCGLTRLQASLYQEAVRDLARALTDELGEIERRGLVLAMLTRLQQICNHPSHWLGDGDYDPTLSGKFVRLRELAEEIAARQEKLLVFTRFRGLTGPLAAFLAEVFGRPGLILHGGTAVGRRQEQVRSFQQEGGAPFFVLSLKAPA
jgi:non-specific serine/threonine protein kinase